MHSNIENLLFALDYLAAVISAACAANLPAPVDPSSISSAPASLPDLAYFDDGSGLGNFISTYQPTLAEYIILLLALAPHIRPDFLERAFRESLPVSGDYPQIGGLRDPETRAFWPTGETAIFLLAGDDLHRRFEVQRILSGDHWFARENILSLAGRSETSRAGESIWNSRLVLNPEYVELFTLGEASTPSFSVAFPARQITTELTWEDLVLGADVLEQIEELHAWLDHHETLMKDWGMRGRLRPGYRVLFYGPPGTGKTLTATLLGKYTGRKVFRIDLSTVVSKYIGETEKNLATLFEKAQHKDWILFFDEADALFGKRTSVKDAHDRYANQEVSYLLQRVEEFDGLVILATNFKANMDEAFLRRFNAIIHFPFPSENERKAIWSRSLPVKASFEEGVDLPQLLSKFELSGGNIINVVQHACIAAISSGSPFIRLEDALTGIRREVEKEGRVFRNLLDGE